MFSQSSFRDLLEHFVSQWHLGAPYTASPLSEPRCPAVPHPRILFRFDLQVHYIGVLEPEFYEADVEIIPLTFPFPSSHIWWPATNVHNNMSLSFEFKSYRSMAVLVSSNVTTAAGTGYWEVRRNLFIPFTILALVKCF